MPASAGDEDVVSATIVAINSSQKTATASSSSPALTVETSKEMTLYATVSFPSEEYRLLALFRFWNVIITFIRTRN
jgi:hypothetical protein